jgi:hypothetical protein
MYHNLALHLDEQILRPDAEDSGSEHEIDIGNESGLVFRSFGWLSFGKPTSVDLRWFTYFQTSTQMGMVHQHNGYLMTFG